MKTWRDYIPCCRCGSTRKCKVRYWSEHEVLQRACLCEVCNSETGTDLKEKEFFNKRKEENGKSDRTIAAS